MIEILDSALENAEHPTVLDKLDLHLPICSASLPLAAIAQFAFPPLLPVAAAVFAYTSIPTFREAKAVLFEERGSGSTCSTPSWWSAAWGRCRSSRARCSAGASASAGCWSSGRRTTRRKLLLNAFGKQPRYVWCTAKGVEVQISMDRLQQGDIIVVNTGEVVPVDGVIVEGMAMIDQHALTGESTPAEKGVGDRVFASTLMVAGKVFVSVEKSGSETASAKISQILNDSAGYKLSSQHKGERLADKAVIPTLAIGAIGLATMGTASARWPCSTATSAPASGWPRRWRCSPRWPSVRQQGHPGQGRPGAGADERDRHRVLFDKTGTLTRERPEVGRIIAANGFSEERILQFAAAAERKFHHPIALAILHKAKELEPRPARRSTTPSTRWDTGSPCTSRGTTVRVGSKRFMEMEGNRAADRGPRVARGLAPRRAHGRDGQRGR